MAVDVPKLLLVLAGSIAVLLQTVVQAKHGWDFFWFWALLVSLLSIVACLPVLVVALCKPAAPDERLHSAPALCLTILWTLGVAPLTMEKPFTLPGNGFFGAWTALLSSWLMTLARYPFLNEMLARPFEGAEARLAGLLLSSLTALLQTAWACLHVRNWCNGNAAWVLICSSVSVSICGALLARQVAQKLRQHFKFMALFLFVWWCAGAVVTTFERPYANSYANGYFGCWAAVAFSALLVDSSWGLSESDLARSGSDEASGGTPREVLALGLASLIGLTASAMDCAEVDCGGLTRWAVACSAGSLAACIGVLLYTLSGGWVTGGTLVSRFAVALLVWWLVGTGCMTFAGPFVHLSNGYFAAWAALVAAYRFAMKNVELLRSRLGEGGIDFKELGGVFFASVVLAVQALRDSTSGSFDGGRAWALVCSVASMLVCGALTGVFRGLQGHSRWLVLALLVWWCFGVLIMTFHWPYLHAGNGYFACWGACGASGRLLVHEFPQLKGYADLGSPGVAARTGSSGGPITPPDSKVPEIVMDPEDTAEPGLTPSVLGSPFSDTNAM